MSLANRLETLPLNSRVVLIGYNPKAGWSSSQGAISRLANALSEQRLEPKLETNVDQIVAESARLAACGELRVVVAAGGDGTAALFANRLGANIPFAVYPLGTENLLAKHLEMPSDPEAFALAVAAGKTVRLDAGLANDQLFLVVASCGFDAEVVRELHGQRRGNISRFSYAWPIFRSIGRYRYPNMRIRVDGGEAFSARWAFVFNAPNYALQLPITPDATCFDGKLDLCSFRRGNLLNGLIYALGVILRQHHKWKDTRLTRCDRLTIESDEPVPYQLDGDPGGVLPVEFKIAPSRLRVVVSEKWLQSQLARVDSASANAPASIPTPALAPLAIAASPR